MAKQQGPVRIFWYLSPDALVPGFDYESAWRSAGITDVILPGFDRLFNEQWTPERAKAIIAPIAAKIGKMPLHLSIGLNYYPTDGSPQQLLAPWGDTARKQLLGQNILTIAQGAQEFGPAGMMMDWEQGTNQQGIPDQTHSFVATPKEMDLVRQYGKDLGTACRQAVGASRLVGSHFFHAWGKDKPAYKQFTRAFYAGAAGGPRLFIDQTTYDGYHVGNPDRDKQLEEFYGADVCCAFNVNHRTDLDKYLAGSKANFRREVQLDRALMIFQGDGREFASDTDTAKWSLLKSWLLDVTGQTKPAATSTK